MDNSTLASLLASTPPAGLRIIDPTAELTLTDGTFDFDTAAARQHEVELACSQARDYASSTARLLETMRWKLWPRHA